jgi:hypothetical protein
MDVLAEALSSTCNTNIKSVGPECPPYMIF